MTPSVCSRTFDDLTCGQVGDHICLPRVAHVVAFFTELLVHTKGDWARKPFIPTDWQRERILTPLFGAVQWDDQRQRYVRRYRELYLFIARKNGKTELLAAITLYLLVGDGEEGAEIYGLALDKDQASLVYRVAVRMVELSDTLSKRLDIYKSTTRIVDERKGSFFTITAGDALGALGANPHGAYIDELLTQPTRDLYDVLRSSFGARAEPMLLMATTAENDPAGFAASERQWSERVAENPDLDRRRLVVMYAADPADDWRIEDTWRQANPALGEFLDIEVLRSECKKAIENPAAERAFRQFRLNQPANAVGRAIDLPVWDAGVGPIPYRSMPETLAGRVAFAGLDLASTQDLASYALAFPDDDGYAVLWRHFAPSSAVPALDRRTGGGAQVWASDGTLTVTEGDVIDYGAIVAGLDADADRYDIRQIGYDRWGATQLATELTEAGWPLIQIGQGFASLSGPTKDFLRLVASRTLRHGGNPLARWEAANLVTRSDPAGNLKPDKAKSMDKIDGIVALIMALDLAMRHVDPPKKYVTMGFR